MIIDDDDYDYLFQEDDDWCIISKYDQNIEWYI